MGVVGCSWGLYREPDAPEICDLCQMNVHEGRRGVMNIKRALGGTGRGGGGGQ